VLRISDGTADLSESHPWWWLAALAAATVVAVGFLVRKYRRHKAFRLAEASAEVTAIGSTESTTELMQRINELMERKKLYLDSELKVSDIAHAFKLHRNDISACINSQTGCTFTQYVNRYRVDYAKQLLRQQPEKKISTVWTEAGFGTEQTFFKIFRAATGVSPKEWAAQCNNLSENAKID
jgi:YesN/AraC family two-component response regulator